MPKSKTRDDEQKKAGQEEPLFQSLVILLATQCLIQLGEIPSPLNKEKCLNLKGAITFMHLLQELERKTSGNLSEAEKLFLVDVLTNVQALYLKKSRKNA